MLVAVAVVTFLVCAIVRAVVVKVEIVGVEPPNPLPVAGPGGRRGRQRHHAAPLNGRVRSLQS